MAERNDRIPFKEYIDARCSELRLYCDSRFAAVEKAAERESAVTGDRFHRTNGVPEQLAVQYAQFHLEMSKYLPKQEYDARHDRIVADNLRIESSLSGYVTVESGKGMQLEIRELRDYKSTMNGRLWAIGIALGVLTVLTQSIIHIIGK